MFKLPYVASCILGCCLLSTASSLVFAQAAAPAKPAIGSLVSPAQTYDKVLSIMEQQFVSAAEAMPEEKFNFAPPASLGEFKGRIQLLLLRRPGLYRSRREGNDRFD
jgi:hypothetical protein